MRVGILFPHQSPSVVTRCMLRVWIQQPPGVRNDMLSYAVDNCRSRYFHADASFVAGENEKSHSGAVVVWGDCPVMWATQRQSTVALSTAEAESHASFEGATMIQSCTPTIASLVGTVAAKGSVYRFCINMFNYSISRWKLEDKASTDSSRGCKVSGGPWIHGDCAPSG